MLEKEATDMHLTLGSPVVYRINGEIVRAKTKMLAADEIEECCFSLLNEEQVRDFQNNKELDFSFTYADRARIRGNLFMQKGSVAGVFRKIPEMIPPLKKLGFNKHVQDLAAKPHGLVLLTGTTGSGKSTSIASFVDHINRHDRKHIITIEDPVEYIHQHHLSIVNQREVGSDTKDFKTALRQVLREDPDVIVVGELRDRETAEAALKSAETGHLVFATLHTNGTISAIRRLVQLFPSDFHDQIRSMLSFTLEGVISQALCELQDSSGRLMVYEFLSMNPSIRHLIRQDKLHQVETQMQLGKSQHGMQIMNEQLVKKVIEGKISYEEAATHSPDLTQLDQIMERAMERAS